MNRSFLHVGHVAPLPCPVFAKNVHCTLYMFSAGTSKLKRNGFWNSLFSSSPIWDPIRTWLLANFRNISVKVEQSYCLFTVKNNNFTFHISHLNNLPMIFRPMSNRTDIGETIKIKYLSSESLKRTFHIKEV